MFDFEVIYPMLAVAMVNLLLMAGTITAVVKILARQRAARNAYRERLALWARAAQPGADPR